MKALRALVWLTIGACLGLGLCRVAHGQTPYLDHRACTDGTGWAVATNQHVLRYYGAIDAQGECEWHLYTIVKGYWTWDGIKRRAASVTSAGGNIVFVPGNVVTPPPPPPPPPVSTGKHYRVGVAILRYQSPPVGATGASVTAWQTTLAALTLPNVQQEIAEVAAWYARESYGLAALDFTVFPPVDLPGNPGCALGTINADAFKVFGGYGTFDEYVALTPYACWQAHAETMPGAIGIYPGFVYDFNQQQLERGTLAHELGHAFGLYHAGGMIPPATVVTEYGNSVDQMGRGGSYVGLTHFMAHHKNALGWLTPLACQSATLASIYTAAQAMRCGEFFVEYLDDWREVWVTRVAYTAGGGGGADDYTAARLRAGQSWTDGTRTITHVVNGQVTVQ